MERRAGSDGESFAMLLGELKAQVQSVLVQVTALTTRVTELQNRVVQIDLARIEKLEEQVTLLRSAHTERKGMLKLIDATPRYLGWMSAFIVGVYAYFKDGPR